MRKWCICPEALPAKSSPFQSVWTHGVTAGIVAQELLSLHISKRLRHRLLKAMSLYDKELTSFIGYLTAVHDIGKLAPRWIERIARDMADGESLRASLRQADMDPIVVPRRRIAHEESSRKIMETLWDERGDRNAALFAGILAAHHQGKAYQSDEDETDSSGRWDDVRMEMAEHARRFFNWHNSLPVVSRKDDAFVAAILTGLVILADWIASSDFFSDAQDLADAEAWNVLRRRAASFIEQSGLAMRGTTFGDTFGDAWPNLKGTERPVQKAVESLLHQCPDPQMLLIEAPMGEGKTEAALYAASRFGSGFYVALPTAAAANQMVERVRAFLEKHNKAANVRLLHSNAWLEQEPHFHEKKDEAARWLDPMRRGLLGQYAVGTVDQAMMAVMNVRYGALRILGLSGKTLLIDELHAYDTYMFAIIRRLLEWCRAIGTPVVLLSATLPVARKRDILSIYGCGDSGIGDIYPGLTAVRQDGTAVFCPVDGAARSQCMRTEILPILGNADAIAARAIAMTDDGGCIAVILNTVVQAQEVYKALKSRVSGSTELLLFHSRFPVFRREEIEKRCLDIFRPNGDRPKRAILVATQVVEQSLDLDFDALLTAVAPVDLILQRMGRIHRHDIKDRPEALARPSVYILTPEEGRGWDSIYPECLLQRSMDVFAQNPAIQLPGDIPRLVEDGYREEGDVAAWAANRLSEEIAAELGSAAVLRRPTGGYQTIEKGNDPRFTDDAKKVCASVRTRLETTPTMRIALLEPALFRKTELACKEKKIDGDTTRAVMLQSVSVPVDATHDIDTVLLGTGRLSGISIYPAEKGAYTDDDSHRTIWYDRELGILWSDPDGSTQL